jgi:pimeloyl-ACP methyl ester carboxylesterase
VPYQKIADVSFYYELFGEKKNQFTLVFIAGYTGDINLWRPIAESMASDCQVLIFDNQGIGKTKDSGLPLTVEAMAANIKSLMDSLSLENPIIAGFAMGCGIAQKLAHDYPESIRKLILLSPVMKFNETAQKNCESLCNLRETGDLATYCDLVYETVFGVDFKRSITQEQFRTAFMPALEACPQKIADQRRQLAALKAFDSSTWAKDIHIPAVIISPVEDQFSLNSESQVLGQAIRSNGTEVSFISIEKSGHGILSEQLDVVKEIFSQYCLDP